MPSILVTSYENPDLDGVSCAVAYAEFLHLQGKNATAAFFGSFDVETKYVFDRFNIQYPEILASTEGFDEFVIVDTCEPLSLSTQIDFKKITEIIDHHQGTHLASFPNAQIQIEMVGAAATLVTEKFMQNNVPISDAAVIVLYGGVLSNTLNFSGTVNMDRDRIAADFLKNKLQIPENFCRDMFLAKSDLSGQRLHEQIAGDSGLWIFGTHKVAIGQLEIFSADELVTERLADILASLEKVRIIEKADHVFLNILDLEKHINIIVTEDTMLQTVLGKIFKTEFVNNSMKADNFFLRKQIKPFLDVELRNKT